MSGANTQHRGHAVRGRDTMGLERSSHAAYFAVGNGAMPPWPWTCASLAEVGGGGESRLSVPGLVGVICPVFFRDEILNVISFT